MKKSIITIFCALFLPLSILADGTISLTALQRGEDTETYYSYWCTYCHYDANYNTFISEGAATVYKVKVVDAVEVYIKRLDVQTVGETRGYIIPANTGVLIQATETHPLNDSPASTCSISFTTTTASSSTDFSDNILQTAPSVNEEENVYYYYKLSYGQMIENQYDYRTLGFYWVNSTGHGPYSPSSGKAYLKLASSGAATAPQMHFILNDLNEENNATDLKPEEQMGDAAYKFIEGGKLYIRKGNCVYDILGNITRK